MGAGEVSSSIAHCELGQACTLLRTGAKVRGKCHEVLKELGLVRGDRGECTICKCWRHWDFLKYKGHGMSQ